MVKRWTFVIVVCVGLLCIISFDKIYCQQETERYDLVLDRFTERLERSLQAEVGQSLHAVEDVQVFMQLGDTLPDKTVFERFVASSLKYYPEATSIGYSDEGYVFRYFYPADLAVNMLGTNLLDTSKYPYSDIVTRKAEREQQITVNKVPVLLPNGSAVFGLRAPLFAGDRFQGMIWVNFLPEKVFQEALAQVDPALINNEGNYYVEIFTQDGESLYRLNRLAPQSGVREFIVPVADTHWLIKTGWNHLPQPGRYIRGLIWGLGSIVVMLLLLLYSNMLRRQDWLMRAVAERTQELLLKNKQLALEILEHEDAERALLTTERRLAALLSAVPDILLRVSREGIILDVEAKSPADLYFPREKLLNKSLIEVLPAELLPAEVYRRFVEISKSMVVGDLTTVEYQLVIKGEKKDYEARMAVSGKDEIAIIVRNITERKQDEECERILMQTSAKVLEEVSLEEILNFVCRKLAAVFEVSLVRVILKEADCTSKISAAAGKMAVADGSRPDCAATGRLCALAIRTGANQVVQSTETLSCWQEQRIAELQLDRADIQSEIALPLKLKDNAAGAFYLISTKPYYWDERIINRLQYFSDQLSIAINAAVGRQRQRLLTVGLEAAANAIVITNRDGSIEWINPAFTVLTGYTELEARGQNLMFLSGYEDKDFCQRFWQMLNTADEAWRGEFAHCRKDGSLYEEVMTITPVRNSREELVNFIAIKEDITEQKLAAIAMAKANEVRAQTEKLSSLGTMAAGLSHEINQPLNSIKMIASGMVYAYNNGKERPVGDIIRNVAEISNQADRINNIITHMRSFIRRDETQEVATCHVNEAIEQSLKIIGSQLTAHGIRVHKELTEQLPLIHAMPTALEELVINLAVNAMQAMDSAEVQDKQITIKTWSSKNNVYIRVSDNGPGIQAAYKSKVFEPFFSTKPGSDNLGLGLSIVHSIVTSCRGTISIVSGEGEGAVFLIIFPSIGEGAV